MAQSSTPQHRGAAHLHMGFRMHNANSIFKFLASTSSHYKFKISLQVQNIITRPSYHYKPKLSLQVQAIITSPSYHYKSRLSLQVQAIMTRVLFRVESSTKQMKMFKSKYLSRMYAHMSEALAEKMRWFHMQTENIMQHLSFSKTEKTFESQTPFLTQRRKTN